jgi:hypothetical protein
MKRAAIVCLIVVSACADDHAPKPDAPPPPGQSAPADRSPRPVPSLNPTNPPVPLETAVDGLCFKPLASFCGGSRPCPTYAESAAETQRFGSSGRCFGASVGTCGQLRFTGIGDGFVSQTRYFNGAGTIVAAHTTTDAISQNPSCPAWTHYGRRLTCEDVVTTNYCAR